MNAHVIAVPFTGVGVGGGFKSQRWFEHRADIFKNYTLKSLANQQNKDFMLWLWFRPEERDNPVTAQIREMLDDSNLNYCMSFEGLLYHDDKFTTQNLKTKLRNFAKMVWDGYSEKDLKPLSQIWKYTWEEKNKTLPDRLERGLKDIQAAMGTDYDWVYLTRLDSDDMLHAEATNLIQSRPPGYRKALVMDKGYMYNTVTTQLAEWLPPTNPPFHTIVFSANIFFNPREHLSYYGAFKSHEDIPKVFTAETLDLYKYCVTAHGGDHISTAWDVPLPKRLYQSVKYARPYCYTTGNRNISTHWESRTTKKKNMMLGMEFTDPEEKRQILAGFGL